MNKQNNRLRILRVPATRIEDSTRDLEKSALTIDAILRDVIQFVMKAIPKRSKRASRNITVEGIKLTLTCNEVRENAYLCLIQNCEKVLLLRI